MCKIFTFTNSTKLDIKKTSEIIAKRLSDLERDGYGYAVQGAQNVFGEKSIADRFTSRLNALHIVKLPIIEKRQLVFGEVDKPTGPALFHGRTSTNDKGLLNCHPMQKDSWHLIHNGVVGDNGPKYKKLTTNDSEDLLHRLILGIDQVEKHLSGYYAFAAISPDGRLHIGRDSVATLYIAWVDKIQSYVISTTENLIENILDDLKLKYGPIDKIENNIYMIFNGNDIVFQKAIKPIGYDYKQASYASKSLGRDLTGTSSAYEFNTYDYYESNKYGDFTAFDSSEIQESDDIHDELDIMDDTYRILSDGETITRQEFYKLDYINQSACTIFRPDNSEIDLSFLYKRVS